MGYLIFIILIILGDFILLNTTLYRENFEIYKILLNIFQTVSNVVDTHSKVKGILNNNKYIDKKFNYFLYQDKDIDI
jgi:hypothetical protein